MGFTQIIFILWNFFSHVIVHHSNSINKNTNRKTCQQDTWMHLNQICDVLSFLKPWTEIRRNFPTYSKAQCNSSTHSSTLQKKTGQWTTLIIGLSTIIIPTDKMKHVWIFWMRTRICIIFWPLALEHFQVQKILMLCK